METLIRRLSSSDAKLLRPLIHQTPYTVASDLSLHCLPVSHKKDTRFIWVKLYFVTGFSIYGLNEGESTGVDKPKF